jgi:hypothetical protein
MNIDQLESYNLGDAVKFNDKLNPKLWGSDEHLKPEVHSKLMEIAEDFRQFLGITDLQLKDITVSGSNAAYTYTPHSDIDLHLVVDLPEADASEVYRELFDAKKYQYNDQHNIKIGGYDVELYVQDANRPHHSQGIYSVLRNDWIDVPKRRKTNIDDVSTQSKYKDLEQRIEQAVASGDYDVMSALSGKIRDLRQSGLDQHGEFGPENLAFKMLRSQGKIKQLYDARNAAKDQLLSLDERRKKKKKKVRYGYGAYWYPGTGYAGQDHAAGSEGGGGDGGGDGGGESIKEDVTPSDEQILKDFIKFCTAELKIKHMPRVKLRRDPQWPVVHKTFGRYIDDANTLEVAFGQRHIMDVLRTVAHELTHKRQHERAAVPVDAGETGSPYENEANARAGVLMRDYGRLHPELFDASETKLGEGASGYIPTKRQAKDPRFSMALTQDIKPGQVGKEANKLGLKTNRQGHPQIARPSGLVEALALEFARFKADEDYSPDEPPGPEFKPTMPKGTVKVDVSDVYDWYKLGQHISNLKGLGKHDFGAGPPASIISFGDEETEHKFIQDLKRTGLDVTDIDPVDPKQPKSMRKIKTDPTYNVAESVEMLDEVKMSPSALQQWATSDAAKGIRAGFEAELIFRDTTNDDDDDGEMEPDYDYDERARSVQSVIDFFNGGDFGGLGPRQESQLQDGLDNQYMEWMDERMYDAFRDEQEDLIKKVLVDEEWDEDNEIQKQLALLDLTDDEINEIIKVGERAPRFTRSSEQQAYIQENPLYQKYMDAQTEAEGLLDELVQDSIRAQDKYYDAALDDFRENFYIDDDSDFFSDVGLSYMSDIASEYNLDWPYMTGSGGGNNGGSRDWEDIGTSLQSAIDMPVKVSSNYHSTTRKEGRWIVEPDSSLDPDDREDFGLEIVSPPLPLLDALEKLQEVTDWANNPSEGNAYTNQSTGLHMGVSVPYKGGDVDYLKLILFLGDEYVLQSFGREANTYTKSAMSKFRENIKGGRADPAGALMLMKNNLIEFAYREIQKGVGTGKYTSAHIQDGYIEFRSAGGDWLAEESADPQKLSSTMLRYARAMQIAADPSAERQEFAKKLYKFVAPEGDSQLALFSQFAAGAIDKDELKKQWAEKTIGTERKINQRWKLYNRATGEAVAGQEYNGYTEDEARARAKGKISPGSSDRDFDAAYELRNTGEEQQWEIYSVDTGKTLEIVKGRNKGEAADAVFDKYAAQKIGFNVRPYQDPATMTPRAKLAKRIASQPGKSLDYNYEIVNQADVRLPVVDKFYATNDTDAQKVYSQWLKNKDLPDDTADYGYRKTAAKSAQVAGVQDVDVNVAQNFDSARDSATLQTNLQDRPTSSAQTVNRSWSNLDEYNWNITNRDTGETLYRINSANRQAAAEYALNYLRNQGLNSSDYQIVIAGAGPQTESIDPVSGAGAVPPRPVIKKISTDKVEPVEPVIGSQKPRSAIGQAISKKDLEDMTQQIKMARRLGDSVMEMEDTPPAVLHALDQAAQKNGYRNWADVKANPRSPQAVMTVAKLASTILRTTGPHHEKLFYKNKTDVDENFADGKNPGRKGLSRRVGIPKKATLGQLEKIAKSSTGERRKMAQWQLNMRRGKAKKNK